MSLLPATSHANPTTPFWERDPAVIIIDAGGNGVVQNFSSTVLFNVITKTFTAPTTGMLVINSAVNFGNTSASAGQFVARIADSVSGGFTTHNISLPIGNVTSQFESACPQLSLQLTKGQSVNVSLALSSTIGTASPSPTYKWDWSMIFYVT